MSQPTTPGAAASRDEDWRDIFKALPRVVRWSVFGVIGLVLLLVLAALAGLGVARSAFPQTDGELDLPGLTSEVRVLRDEHGIPQIYADSMDDLMRAQGFVHAQERFYEMDVRRHITSGRLSEMFGPASLEIDKTVRTMGWRRVAEKELGLVSPRTRRALEAYAAGVNAYLESRSPRELAVEYSLLRLGGLEYHPEKWTPTDSLAWLKAMAWDLRANVEDEIARALLSARHSPSEVAQLYPPYDERVGPVIVDQGAVVDGVFEPEATQSGTRNPQRPAYTAGQRKALSAVADAMRGMPELVGRGDGIGSNSWVVDANHSDTGTPILANDPHLSVSQPGVWMQMGLHCNEVSPDCPLDVAGFTFSGTPGVIIGHNADIAWGFTNMGPDTADLFLEKVREGRWRHAGQWREFDSRTETIKVRGGEDVRLEVRETSHGPVLSDVSADLSTIGANAAPEDEQYAVSLAWSALRPMPTADAILGFNVASNWDEFREAARSFAVPSQNLVYADREGHIGYQAPGWIPIRRSGNDGRMPSEGWKPENEWTGDAVPFDALPHLFDPPSGMIITANQKVTGNSYPYYLGTDWDPGYRAGRIHRLLESSSRFSVDDMTLLQLDNRHPLASALVPVLLELEPGSAYYTDGQDLLRTWDFRQGRDSAAAAYFNAVWSHVLARTFHDDLRTSLWPTGGGRWMSVVTDLLDEPSNPWWDDASTEDVVESRDDILVAAMRDARDDLTAHVAVDPQDWTWGAMHRLNLRNQTLGTSGIGPVEWVVNRGGFGSGGGSAAVNATNWDASQGYEVTSAPSMRMVVTPGRWDDSRWINLTGVSGHPFHPHYADQTRLWVNGDTLPWAFGRDAVVAAAEDTLTLRPAEAP